MTANGELAKGGTLLAVAMLIANAGNYVLNLSLGRWLTPSEFADANLMVTIMLLVTAVAISLQLIASRFTAMSIVSGDEVEIARLRRYLDRRAGLVGLGLGAGLVFGAPFWSDLFRSESTIPFVILGLGMPFYVTQAVGRGILQGRLRFTALGATFVVEMLVRVGLGLALVSLGFGVVGATIALAVSFVAVWVHVRILMSNKRGSLGAIDSSEVRRYAGPIALLLLGQIIVNNGDVLIAKRYLDPDQAGVYAAIALVGRAVFFLSWSVATTLFPAATQQAERGQDVDQLLHRGLLVVGLLGTGAVVGAQLFGGFALELILGPAFAGLGSPLAWYAGATSLFALANLIVSHYLSIGRYREAVLLLGGGLLQTALLLSMRGSMQSLINAQVLAMTFLLLMVMTSHLLYRQKRSGSNDTHAPPSRTPQATVALEHAA